ncbi:MAG: sodium:calcium antiporter [Candidatus Vogelbacteria bacterium]|nr:sodium:calcium antiporter [Candidatus Vogelbacteria bacterium]
MINNLLIFIISLSLVIKGATLATKYAAKLASGFQLSKYTIGFIIVAGVSILPETFISISSALKGVPSFGLGVLFGSNIADLTLVFTIIILTARRGIKIESKILKNDSIYPFLLLLPLAFGLDGYFSRLEGTLLIVVGIIFYWVSLKNGVGSALTHEENGRCKSLFLFLVSMIMLLIGSHFTVTSATLLATALQINPILIGMLIVGLGTTLPELLFSLKSVRAGDDSLAIGDVLGTVLADATIVVGILAIINPFSFPQQIIYVTGIFMVLAASILFRFMKSGKTLTTKEGYALLAFWVIFVLVEFIAN